MQSLALSQSAQHGSSSSGQNLFCRGDNRINKEINQYVDVITFSITEFSVEFFSCSCTKASKLTVVP